MSGKARTTTRRKTLARSSLLVAKGHWFLSEMETTSGLPVGHQQPSELRDSSYPRQIQYKGGKKRQASSLINLNFSGTHLQSFPQLERVVTQTQRTYPETVDVDSNAVLRGPVACSVWAPYALTLGPSMDKALKEQNTEPTKIEHMQI